MKISTKSRYALHLMLALAMQEDGGNLSVKSVAESQGISEKYLEQVIPTLILYKNGKAVDSVVNPGSKAAIDQFIQEALAK